MSRLKISIYVKETLVSWGLLHIIRERYPDALVEVHRGLYKLTSPENEELKIIILDPSLLDPPGHVTLEKIYRRNPGCKLIAVSSKNPDENQAAYFEGVIFPGTPEEEILSILANTLDLYDGQVKEAPSTNLISEREKDVLRGVALGLTNKEISENLNISCHTVITHRKNISAKIGIKTIAGLAVYAVLNRIIDPEELESF